MTEREPIPAPKSSTEGLLGVLARRQDETNDLLRQILDRLPGRPDARPDGTVELTEPKRPAGGGGKRASAGAGAPRPAPRRNKNT